MNRRNLLLTILAGVLSLGIGTAQTTATDDPLPPLCLPGQICTPPAASN